MNWSDFYEIIENVLQGTSLRCLRLNKFYSTHFGDDYDDASFEYNSHYALCISYNMLMKEQKQSMNFPIIMKTRFEHEITAFPYLKTLPARFKAAVEF